jgi:hypothetical protein
MTNFTRRRLLGAAIASTAGLIAPRAFAAAANGARPSLVPRALAALDRYPGASLKRDRLAIVDFARHSAEARFHLIDIASGRVLGSYLVAHGRGSDPANSGWLQRFSNRPGSNASAEGSYVTSDTYHGKHGLSRRLIGLDADNNLALQRGIVIHAADYVSDSLIRNQGRIGRSQGCFAVPQGSIAEVLDRLGPGRLLFASR